MAKSKSAVLAASFKVLASFGCSPKSALLRQPNASRLRSEAAHMAKSKRALLFGSKSASEWPRITLQSSSPNLKYKTEIQEHKEHEFGTVVSIRLQVRERPNPSFKRTYLRHAA